MSKDQYTSGIFLFVFTGAFVLGGLATSIFYDYKHNLEARTMHTKDQVKSRETLACLWGVTVLSLSISSNDPKDKFKTEMCDFENSNPYQER